MTTAYALPRLSRRFVPVWRRNFLVWRKLAVPSVLFNLADPTIYMLGLGYGLGALMPEVDGRPYIVFLAAGTVCFSTMNTATFETLYSAFSRMHVQKTWDAIVNAPVGLDDVVLAELVWAAAKSFLSGLAIFLVIWALGLVTMPPRSSHSPSCRSWASWRARARNHALPSRTSQLPLHARDHADGEPRGLLPVSSLATMRR
jgi:hypothetical protein